MMKLIQFEECLQRFLRRRPFQPFVIELEDGKHFLISRKEELSYYAGDSALYVAADGSMQFIDRDNVVRISEQTVATP